MDSSIVAHGSSAMPLTSLVGLSALPPMEEFWGCPVELDKMPKDMGDLIGNNIGTAIDARKHSSSPPPLILDPTPHSSEEGHCSHMQENLPSPSRFSDEQLQLIFKL
jgi:hypothetical protein